MVSRVYEITYRPICYYSVPLRFLTFLRFFQNPKSRDFLRFFAVSRTFSRTMIDTSA